MTNLLLQQDSDPLYFQHSDFLGLQNDTVFHGFFSRRGGVSRDIFATLNCGPGSGEALSIVQKNRQIVSEIAGCEAKNLLSLHQIHSDQCLVVRESWDIEARLQGDAMVTDVPGLALGVLTADCAPVLFYGRKSDGAPVVGAAHAGWSGALKGVLGTCVEAMLEIGAVPESIRACIGPCIGQKSYEVSEAFAEPFLKEDDGNEAFFMAGQRAGHLQFDLPGYCAAKLGRAGVKNVLIKDLDTYFNEEDFFSYRRAMHRHEKDYGRQISVVTIQE